MNALAFAAGIGERSGSQAKGGDRVGPGGGERNGCGPGLRVGILGRHIPLAVELEHASFVFRTVLHACGQCEAAGGEGVFARERGRPAARRLIGAAAPGIDIVRVGAYQVKLRATAPDHQGKLGRACCCRGQCAGTIAGDAVGPGVGKGMSLGQICVGGSSQSYIALAVERGRANGLKRARETPLGRDSASAQDQGVRAAKARRAASSSADSVRRRGNRQRTGDGRLPIGGVAAAGYQELRCSSRDEVEIRIGRSDTVNAEAEGDGLGTGTSERRRSGTIGADRVGTRFGNLFAARAGRHGEIDRNVALTVRLKQPNAIRDPGDGIGGQGVPSAVD